MKRAGWDWLIILIVGIAVGLVYAWVISPTHYIDTTPSTLRADFKDQYRMVISAAYVATRDIDRARLRLALLGDPDSYQALSALAQQMLAGGQSFVSAQQVAELASALKGESKPRPTNTETILTPLVSISMTPSSSPSTGSISPTEIISITDQPQAAPLTPTPRPTRTPTTAPGAPFVAADQQTVCAESVTQGLLMVYVIDSRRRPLPGIELIVTWEGGEDHFFTGFKPEIGDGYADYQMQTGIAYTLRVASGGAPIPDITIPSCPSANGTVDGSLSITLQGP